MRKLKILIIFLILFGGSVLIYRYFSRVRVGQNETIVSNAPGAVGQLLGVFEPGVATKGIIDGGPPREGIKSIDNPSFESVKDASVYLRDTGKGIAAYDGVNWRFYPFQVLVWHEMVNDTLAGVPVALTYSPLTGSSLAFKRVMAGNNSPLTFRVTAKVFNGNTVLTWGDGKNLVSQINATVISGNYLKTSFDIVSSDIMDWQYFRTLHPDGRVLTRPAGSKNDYNFDPYGDYYSIGAIYYPVENPDERFPAKTELHGIVVKGEPKAYINSKVAQKTLINDELAGVPLVIWMDPASRAVRIFERRAAGKVLSFEIKGARLFDHQTDSSWNFDGQAVSGKLRGSQLPRVSDMTAYWYFWYSFYPSTIVWGL